MDFFYKKKFSRKFLRTPILKNICEQLPLSRELILSFVGITYSINYSRSIIYKKD